MKDVKAEQWAWCLCEKRWGRSKSFLTNGNSISSAGSPHKTEGFFMCKERNFCMWEASSQRQEWSPRFFLDMLVFCVQACFLIAAGPCVTLTIIWGDTAQKKDNPPTCYLWARGLWNSGKHVLWGSLWSLRVLERVINLYMNTCQYKCFYLKPE